MNSMKLLRTPRPGRPQFGIRALVCYIGILGICLAWTGHNARVQRDAVRAVRRAGGSVRYDRKPTQTATSAEPRVQRCRSYLATLLGDDYFYHVTSVTFSSGKCVSDRELAQVGRFRELRSLVALRTDVSDDGLAQLRGLTELTTLVLDSPRDRCRAEAPQWSETIGDALPLERQGKRVWAREFEGAAPLGARSGLSRAPTSRRWEVDLSLEAEKRARYACGAIGRSGKNVARNAVHAGPASDRLTVLPTTAKVIGRRPLHAQFAWAQDRMCSTTR